MHLVLRPDDVAGIAVEGDGVSYGLSYCPDCKSPYATALPPTPGFVWHHKNQYQPYATVSPQSMLVPFISESNYLIAPVRILPTYALSLSTAQVVSLCLIAFVTWTNSGRSLFRPTSQG